MSIPVVKPDYGISSLLCLLASGSFLLSVLLTHTLWDRWTRNLPSCPLFMGTPALLGKWFYVVLTFCLLAGLAMCLVASLRKIGIGLALSSWLVFVVCDINCFQPSFYFFATVLLLCWFVEWQLLESLQFPMVLRCMLAALYTFGGIHKVNPVYHESIYEWLSQTYVDLFPNAIAQEVIGFLGKGSPFIEILLGLGLLIPLTQRAASFLAICLHLFVLFALGPWGHNFNYVIFPWNICLILIHTLLFKRHSTFHHFLKKKGALLLSLVFWAVPLIGLGGYADMYVSHDLYSGKAYFGFILVPTKSLPSLPFKIRSQFQPYDATQSYCSLTDWSFKELNVPLYPERRVLLHYKHWFEKKLPTVSVTLIISRMQHHETIQ